MDIAPRFLAFDADLAAGVAIGTPQSRTVRRAARDCGGVSQLAKLIHADASDVRHWYAGESLPPTRVYIALLEIVADWPLHPGAC